MDTTKTKTLNAKQRRVLDRCFRELFGKKAFDDSLVLKELDFYEVIRRLVSVSDTRGFQRLLSANAADALDRIVSVMQDVGVGENEAVYSDIRSGVRRVVETCFARGDRPKNADELLESVQREVDKGVEDRLFLASIFGVKFDGVQEIQLGSMTISAAVDAFIDSRGISSSKARPEWLVDSLRKSSCIAGTFRGTFNASKLKFTELAHLTSGFLAVIAGYSFSRGATNFDIRVQIGSSAASGASGFLFWNDDGRTGGWGTNGGSSQALQIDERWARDLTEPGFMSYGFGLLQRPAQTDVESAIARAVYWYGDAHRDPVSVMQFVKYWSCIECFFSMDEKDVTEALALGVAGVLTFGHYPFFSRTDYARNRAMVKNMYKKRSQAVHSAVHSHVNAQDLISISQWAASIIVNMVSFAHADLPSRRVLFSRLQKLDSEELGRT